MYYHTDALGSIRNMTANNGSSLGEMGYSPFGERVESTGVLPFMGFTGEPMSPTTDLTYLRARYYNPSLGRFLTQDAIVPDPLNGQAWNAYAYVYNDVVNLTDPTGHFPWLAIGIATAINTSIEYYNQVSQNWANCIFGLDAFTNIDSSRLLVAAGIGAVAGVAGAWIGTYPALVRPLMVGGVNAGLSFSQRKLNGEPSTLSDAAMDFAIGVGGGFIGEVAGIIGKPLLGYFSKNRPEAIVIKNPMFGITNTDRIIGTVVSKHGSQFILADKRATFLRHNWKHGAKDALAITASDTALVGFLTQIFSNDSSPTPNDCSCNEPG